MTQIVPEMVKSHVFDSFVILGKTTVKLLQRIEFHYVERIRTVRMVRGVIDTTIEEWYPEDSAWMNSESVIKDVR